MAAVLSARTEAMEDRLCVGCSSNSSEEIREKDDGGDDDDDEGNLKEWRLPQGAEYIIRQIAAEYILFSQLGDIFGMAVVGQKPKSASMKKAEFASICRIVQEFPGTCQRKYEFRWEDETTRELFPFAAMCCLRPTLEVIQAMHQANPEAIRAMEITRESLPLHYACGFGASLEVVRFLVEAYPEAISSGRLDKVTPLHLACAYYKGGEPDVINYLLDRHPEGASQMATDMGWLPLHSSAHGGVPPSILERLTKLVPNSVTMPDSKGRTPLHIACERKGNLETVRFLLSQAPQLADREDESRFTPISLAAMHQTVTVLELLLQSNEMLEDHHGVTLLHMAAFQNDVTVIEFLAERYPYMITARVRDGDQYTPLLAACRHNASVDVVRALIQHDPSTLTMPDGDGRPPIESARQAGADPIILQVMQDELNACAAAAFEHSWPPPFTSSFSSYTTTTSSSSEFRTSDLVGVIPSLESVPSFSSDYMMDSLASSSISTAPSAVEGGSGARCLPSLRWLRFWRRSKRC